MKQRDWDTMAPHWKARTCKFCGERFQKKFYLQQHQQNCEELKKLKVDIVLKQEVTKV